MNNISAKFDDTDNGRLTEICDTLKIDKSEALRRATQQMWLSLQIGKTFEERAGGPPTFTLRSANSSNSSRAVRHQKIGEHLARRSEKRKDRRTK